MDTAAAAATSLSQARTGQEAAVLVAKKVFDSQKLEGQAAVQLLEAAAAISDQVAAANRLDVTA